MSMNIVDVDSVAASHNLVEYDANLWHTVSDLGGDCPSRERLN